MIFHIRGVKLSHGASHPLEVVCIKAISGRGVVNLSQGVYTPFPPRGVCIKLSQSPAANTEPTFGIFGI